jgi:GH35 family endo-1,4-beta-xylanase
MEMHLLGRGDAAQHDKQGMIEIMQGFGNLGVRVYITEMDVDLSFLQGQYSTQTARWQYQGGVYKDMVDACIESRVCDSFSTMDIGDSMSAITTSCPGCPYKPELNGDPTLFDDSFLPKPAYFAVRDAFAGR